MPQSRASAKSWTQEEDLNIKKGCMQDKHTNAWEAYKLNESYNRPRLILVDIQEAKITQKNVLFREIAKTNFQYNCGNLF